MLRILVLAFMLGLWSGSALALGSPSRDPGGDYETGGNEAETDGAGDSVIRKQYTVQDATNAALDQGNTVSITYK